MKFIFESEYGQTEISISDLAGSSVANWSSIKTSVVTNCDTSLKNHLSIVLPPLFSKVFERFRKDVSAIYLSKTKHWVKSHSVLLRAAIDPKKISAIKSFTAIYFKAKGNIINLQTTDYLGKHEQILSFLKFHLSLLKLISET